MVLLGMYVAGGKKTIHFYFLNTFLFLFLPVKKNRMVYSTEPVTKLTKGFFRHHHHHSIIHTKQTNRLDYQQTKQLCYAIAYINLPYSVVVTN